MAETEPILEREIYFIRHAQSRGNIERDTPTDITDREDPLLTPLGEKQAELLGEYLKDENFAAVYSSPLMRTVATAEQVVRRQKSTDKLLILPPLTEIWVSTDYPGQTMDSLHKISPGAEMSEGYSTELPTVRYDKDSLETEMFKRAGEALDYLFSRHNSGEKIAVVSHAGFLTYMLFYLIGYRDAEPFYDFRLSNTGVTRILFFKPGTNKYGDIIFDCMNERTHLLGL